MQIKIGLSDKDEVMFWRELAEKRKADFLAEKDDLLADGRITEWMANAITEKMDNLIARFDRAIGNGEMEKSKAAGNGAAEKEANDG